MATLVFTVVGTALGGPLGGAIGGLIGRQVDQSVFGGGSREGPRLKELSLTSSSYGQAVPRIFGRMRVGGTVIWSTELIERSSRQGGKGQPKTTTYSYSASFAVAVSSTPITRIGRIWADGNLLRGANEDLKVQGKLRVYRGHGDDPVDPLIAADKGDSATAFRDFAYVVFEDLELGDFGNRIPTITFEVFASEAAQVRLRDIVPAGSAASGNDVIVNARGYADDGGPVASSLTAIDRVLPLVCAVNGEMLEIGVRSTIPANTPLLPRQLSTKDAKEAGERFKQRGNKPEREPFALRYYDEGRDYQPGVQRASGSRKAGRELMIELPATMTADGAKQLANANAHQARWRSERIVWRVVELDPSIQPGSIVRLPDTPGHYLVKNWEWFDQGIELGLERMAPQINAVVPADAGIANPPVDVPNSETTLVAIEVPPEASTAPQEAIMFAAASAQGPAWAGAALYVEQGNSLLPIGSSGSRRTVTGQLASPLAPSPCILFEPNAALVVSGVGAGLEFETSDLSGLANGVNRVCVGDEVLQFVSATEVGAGEWQLKGLLRGRGGTEDAAAIGHNAGTSVVLLDERLSQLNSLQVASDPSTRIAAIGRGDEAPVFAVLQNAGLSRRPPVPVHPQVRTAADGSQEYCWTRRARGQWRWDLLFEIPLIEQSEAYLVGFGPVGGPHKTWSTAEPRLAISSTELSSLTQSYGPGQLWVQQIGTFAVSPPLKLAQLP